MEELERPLIGSHTLKARGWTPAMIKRFLGNPDSADTNPQRKSRMKLWKRDRILAAEADDRIRPSQTGGF